MIAALIGILLFSLIVIAVMKQAKFGTRPGKTRLKLIEQSPNYKNGAFQNKSITPSLTEGATYYSVLKQVLFGEKKRKKPYDTIPGVKTDLIHLTKSEDVIIWFGHSSYFMQLNGKTILVDPVLSGAASPFSFTTRAFKGADKYAVEDLPEIDYLFITHDHWDHLDYKTVVKLKAKVKNVICGLGTGEHLEKWGYDKTIIVELDWNKEVVLDKDFIVNAVPARHFSGRGLIRNKALWVSFVLQTPRYKIFIGGDSGYDTHFLDIGNRFGPFDLAILENGQYDKSWKYIHMQPEEVLHAAKNLSTKKLFPVHSSKFALANHDWDDPLKRIVELNKQFRIPLITPMIGEKVNLNDNNQLFLNWWEQIN